jgi:hypothetical protein
MIKKTSQGYKVTSEEGKNLSAPDLSKAGAHKRLAEVEYFKSHPEASGGKKHPPRYKPAYHD